MVITQVPIETLWKKYSDLPATGHWRYCPGCGLGIGQAADRPVPAISIPRQRHSGT